MEMGLWWLQTPGLHTHCSNVWHSGSNCPWKGELKPFLKWKKKNYLLMNPSRFRAKRIQTGLVDWGWGGVEVCVWGGGGSFQKDPYHPMLNPILTRKSLWFFVVVVVVVKPRPCFASRGLLLCICVSVRVCVCLSVSKISKKISNLLTSFLVEAFLLTQGGND